MKADLTRLTHRPEQHFRNVRMQQGRVQLDADWNEQQDILHRRIEQETADSIGSHGSPLAGAGFALVGDGGNIEIGAGHFYTAGLLCENPTPSSVIKQPHLPAPVSPILAADSHRFGLPPAGALPLQQIRIYNGSVAEVPEDGVYLGYLEAWVRHVTALEDPLIREVALGGPDTATREQLVWHIGLLRVGGPGSNLTCQSDFAAWTALTAAPDGRLGARAEPGKPPKDPCFLTPEAGYRRLENRLYRVEVHDDGSTGELRYKWSRDNGSIVSRITRWLGDPAPDELEVDTLGRDAYLSIGTGCWLEFTDDTREALGLSGPLVRVLKTEGRIITLDLASATGSLDQGLFAGDPRVRRWEGWDRIEPQPTSASYEEGWMELEDGVEIRFTGDTYRVGDYWTIPARTATADVEWPREAISRKALFLSPHGVTRAFARLALLRCQGGDWTTTADCRPLFPALTELTNLYYVGGDGQEVMPDPLNAMNVALDHPLEVAVFNGQFPVAGAQVRFTASAGGTLNQAASPQTAITQTNGIASMAWELNPGQPSQTCTAELLEAGQAVTGKYNSVRFSARLSIASQVAYDAAGCSDLQAAGVSTVQAALDALCQRSHAGSSGCCRTVGATGEFPSLDRALRELLAHDERDLCLCLLPGEHRLEDSIDLGGKEGIHLFIHGAGPASRLVLHGQEFNLFDFSSVVMRDFDIQANGDPQALRLMRCGALQLMGLSVAGPSLPGSSLVQIESASRIDIADCRITTWQRDALPRGLRLIDAIPLLAPMARALQPDSAELFAPLPAELANGLAAFDDDLRKQFSTEVHHVMRDPAAALTAGEHQAMHELTIDVGTGNAARIAAGLTRLRLALLQALPAPALCLHDAGAPARLTDNHLHGALSLYGETRDEENHHELLKAVATGHVTLGGQTELWLRNNHLGAIRLGGPILERMEELVRNGGVLNEIFRSLVADANVLDGRESELAARLLSLGQNTLLPWGDFGAALANQGKYLGNFADNDFRLFIFGHRAEAFGNGQLNIVG